MSLLSRLHFHPLKPQHNYHKSCPTRTYCVASNKTTKPRLTACLPSTTADRVTLDDLSLKSTWSHRAWVASGCIAVGLSLARCVTAAVEAHIWLEPVLAGLVGYVLADLTTGVYHWVIDNYGDSSTPFFGSQIVAFQDHHKWPWITSRKQFANNIHLLSQATTFMVLPIDVISNDPILHGFVAPFFGFVMFSQQFHTWAHATKSRLPATVVLLQDLGMIISPYRHGPHHRPPYNSNYCIVNGMWNDLLDDYKVFEAMEMVLFFKLGIQPRSWSEPKSDWTEDADELPF